MGNVARWTNDLTEWDVAKLTDDFQETLSTSRWTVTVPDCGSALVGDGVGGILTLLPSDGSVANNDEVYVASAKQLYLLKPGQSIYGRILLQYAEGDVNKANVGFGFMSSVGADALLDNAGGPAAATTAITMYKIDGGTVWRCQSRNGTEVYDTISNYTAGGSAYELLEIFVHDYTLTRAEVTFKVNGQFLKDSVFNKPIVHTIYVDGTNGAPAKMSFWFGQKNGEDVTVETMLVDRVYASQNR
jgi:hypothetical protein